jgi:pyruvate ferredoxin oxidoreductase delta subunit
MTEDNKPLGERMKLPWQQMPLGGVAQPGSSVEYRTGDWRLLKKPVIDHKRCIMCLLCWVFCPDVSITRSADQVEIDYNHCKGCGICSAECPVRCISMVEE